MLLLLLGMDRSKAIHHVVLGKTSRMAEINRMGLVEKGRWVKVHSAFHYSSEMNGSPGRHPGARLAIGRRQCA